jgi:aspartyl-tRNA(Asn)/glutamyl-tRNA(Gln) amidotransferase subunit A
VRPWELGAAEAAGLIREKALSPVELVDSCLDRIAALDADLRAWVTVDGEGARRAAAALQERLAGASATGLPALGPLAAVPVGIKDVIDVAGLPTTASSRVLAAAGPAADDAGCVGRLRQAGAVIAGKLHTAEFACADPPATRNPWNAAHTPGGSSSGSAVAVAAGMIPAALGTQTGGSTLRPASYNGLVGVKPSYGLISNRGVIPVAWSLDHVGVIARSVADAALVLAGLAGHDPLDPASSPRADEYRPPGEPSGRAPVIGLIRPVFLERCEPPVLEHTLAVAGRLEAAGAEVREITLPGSFADLVAGASLILRTEMHAYHRVQFARHREQYGPLNTAILDAGGRTAAADYVLAARARPGLVAELERSLAGVDLALTPGTPAPAPRDTSTTGDASFQAPWTCAGLPTVALPTGVNEWGIPLGIQLIGHRWGDAALLRQARWCEDVIGFTGHPPCWAPGATVSALDGTTTVSMVHLDCGETSQGRPVHPDPRKEADPDSFTDRDARGPDQEPAPRTRAAPGRHGQADRPLGVVHQPGRARPD